jgi:hypothetical protein
VGVQANSVHGGGTLTISPGVLLLETGSLMRRVSRLRQLKHTDPEVVIVTARLVAPWFNVSIRLHGNEGVAVVSVPILVRSRLHRSLAAAGFDVREVKTLTSRGRPGDAAQEQARFAAGGRPWWLGRGFRVWNALGSALVAAALVVLVSHAVAFVGVLVAVVALNCVTIFWPKT